LFGCGYKKEVFVKTQARHLMAPKLLTVSHGMFYEAQVKEMYCPMLKKIFDGYAFANSQL
jgi:hypothetical protein